MTSQYCSFHSKLLSDIWRTGWHIIGVFPTEENPLTWSYSVGLYQTFGHPEVIVFGLPPRAAAGTINAIGKQVQAGKHFQPGEESAEFFDAPWKSVFQTVDRTAYEEHVGQALWFYEDARFPLLQLVWSDEQQLLPWHLGCDEYVQAQQPLLFTANGLG